MQRLVELGEVVQSAQERLHALDQAKALLVERSAAAQSQLQTQLTTHTKHEGQALDADRCGADHPARCPSLGPLV